MRLAFTVVVAVSIASVALSAPPDERLPHTPGRHTIQFSKSAIQSNADEVKWRLHSIENPGTFDITKERFQLIIPTNYKADEQWGLFIWIGAGNAPNIPPPWETVLASRKLLFVGAHESGNKRDIFDRIRMAIDASVEMRRQYRIDERRVYVAGFSGGARVASMVGVAFADVFTGAMPFMGVNFYTELNGDDGKRFGITYIPDDEVLKIAKAKCRYVLVTAEKDFNRSETHAAKEQGFRKEGFANVLCLEVPGIGHAMPDAKWLKRGLSFLDGEDR